MKSTGKSNQVIANVILNKPGVNGNRAIALKVVDTFFSSQQSNVQRSAIRKATNTITNSFQSVNGADSIAFKSLPNVKKNKIDTKKSVEKASINAEKNIASAISIGETAKAAAKQASAKATAAAAALKKSKTTTTTRSSPGARSQTVQVGVNGRVV